MTQNWYPFYVGDYDRKTAHLSLLEHGAYRLLLDHYYATGEPLPNNPIKLYRICRARTPSERKSVLSAAYQFFIKDGTLLRSKKCDSVLAKQLSYSNSQSAKAKQRHSHGNAVDMLHARVTKTITKEEVSSGKVNFEKSQEEKDKLRAKNLLWKKQRGVITLNNSLSDNLWLEKYEKENPEICESIRLSLQSETPRQKETAAR